jgi:hypothetical protein
MNSEANDMAQLATIEGTGAELLDYLKQAPDERFRLIRLSDDAAVSNGNGTNNTSLAEALQGYIGAASFGDANLSQDTGRKFTQLLADKHRKEQE